MLTRRYNTRKFLPSTIYPLSNNKFLLEYFQVPTSDNTTLPVQIQLPQLVTTSSPDGTTSTVVLQSPIQQESLSSQSQTQSIDQQIQQQIQQQLQLQQQQIDVGQQWI